MSRVSERLVRMFVWIPQIIFLRYCKNHNAVTIMAHYLWYAVYQVSLLNPCPTPSQFQRLDLSEAKASVQADADAIKERIQKEHQSFEYVNQTVEQALWCEVIKFLEADPSNPSNPTSTGSGSTSEAAPPDSESWEVSDKSSTLRAKPKSECQLQ